MATKYWRGGAGTWDATTSTNWSDTSGGAGGAIAPCALDDVVFNSASNNNAYTVTIAAGAVCRSLNIAGPNSGNVTVAGSGALGIFGSLTIAATGVTRTYTGAITFRSTTTGNTITTNGISLASLITFNGIGGEWTLGSAFTSTGNWLLTNGTVNTSNFAVSIADLASQSGSSVLNLGSSSVSISGSATAFNSNFVSLNAGTSTITASSASFGIGSAAHTGSTFYNVTMTSAAKTSTPINGSNVFNNLTFTTPTNSSLNSITLGGNQTINGTLTVSGSGAINRYMFLSNIIGTARTLTVNTVSALTDVDFRDITVAGTSSPWSGTRLGNCLGNTNITFGAGVNKYWNLAAGGTWNAAAWATTSGGTASALNFPLAQDTAIIENTGLNNSASITAFQNYNLGGLNTSTRTNAATISGSTNAIRLYGNYSLGTGADFSSSTISFEGRSTQTATTNGKQWLGVTINCAGTVSLSDALLNTANFTFTKGTLTTNNFNMSITASILFTSTEAKVWNLGSSTITTIEFGSSTAGLNVTINAGTSTINISADSTVQGFEGQNTTFYNMVFTIAPFTNSFRGNNTFNNLTFTSPTSVGSNGITLFGNITINGTLAFGGGTSVIQRMRFFSNSVGTARTISASTVTGLTDIDFRDITATGAANWTTGTRLGNCGGNTGITFPAAKTVYWNLTGAQNWSATAWATASGGTPAVNNFPLAQDTAVFDNTGAATTVTMNAAWNIGTLSAGSRTTAWTLSGTGQAIFYGNITYGSGITASNTGTYTFSGVNNQTYTTAGKSLTNAISINKPSSQFLHGDAYTSSSSISITAGQYLTQNFNITTSQYSATGGSANFGSSTITITGASPWSANSSSFTLNAGTSTINLTSTATKTLGSVGSFTFYNLSNNGGTNTTALVISGNNTFNTLSNTANQDLELTSGTTQTVTNFNYTGTVGNVVDIRSSIPGLQATLLKASGAWYAGANSTNGGNNSGWTFTAGGSTNYAYIKDIVATVTFVPNSNFFFFLR